MSAFDEDLEETFVSSKSVSSHMSSVDRYYLLLILLNSYY